MDTNLHSSGQLPSLVKLHIASNVETQTIILAQRQFVRIGRALSNDITTNDLMLSNLHAAIVHMHDSLWILDRGSTNGTYVNGKRIVGRRELAHGDIVIVANIRITADISSQLSSPGKITEWIKQARSNKRSVRELADAELWERYASDVRAIVKRRRPFFNHIENDEDIAIQALTIMFRALSNGKFRQIQSRRDFWNVLRTITFREVYRVGRKYSALKRNRNTISIDRVQGVELSCAARNPSPGEKIDIEDVLQLASDELRAIVLLKVEGYSNKEIATKLSVSERTMERRLRRARSFLAAALK